MISRGVVIFLMFFLIMPFRDQGLTWPEKPPLSTLSQQDLQLIPGIGPVMAAKLRDGDVRHPEKIKGMGEHRIKMIKRFIILK